jgi:hypothetical protein
VPNSNVKLWTDALRSGEYKQTRGALKNQHGYCCLGVACDIALKNGVEIVVTESHSVGDIPGFTFYNGHSVGLPDVVRDFFGLRDRYGKFEESDISVQDLANLNDSRNLTFEQIADVIDSNPKGLFV